MGKFSKIDINTLMVEIDKKTNELPGNTKAYSPYSLVDSHLSSHLLNLSSLEGGWFRFQLKLQDSHRVKVRPFLRLLEASGKLHKILFDSYQDGETIHVQLQFTRDVSGVIVVTYDAHNDGLMSMSEGYFLTLGK